MKFDQFLNPDNKKPLHSSGYAETANGGSFGSTSPQSFQQRRRIEQNRHVIQQYRDSYVAHGSHLRDELRQRLDAPIDSIEDDSKDPRTKHRRRTNRQMYNARSNDTSGSVSGTKGDAQHATQPPKNTSFQEPSSRGYNPYS